MFLFSAIAMASIITSNTAANAQMSVRGTFSSQPTQDGWYVISCNGNTGICGMLGRTYPDGSIYFKASDGSEWRLYSLTAPTDEGRRDELENGSSVAIPE